MNGSKELYLQDKFSIINRSIEKFKNFQDPSEMRKFLENQMSNGNSNLNQQIITSSVREQKLPELVKLNKPFVKNEIGLKTRYRMSNNNLKNSIESLKEINKNIKNHINNPYQLKHTRTLSHQMETTNKSHSPVMLETPEKSYKYASNFHSYSKNEKGMTGIVDKIDKNPIMNININLNMNVNHNHNVPYITNDVIPVLPNLNHKDYTNENKNSNENLNLLKTINHIKHKSSPQVIIKNNHILNELNNNQEGDSHINKNHGLVFTRSNFKKFNISKENNSRPPTLKIKKISPMKFSSNFNEEIEIQNGDNKDNNMEEKRNFTLVKKVSFKSRPGVNFEGIVKTNQDALLVKRNIFNLNNFSIFGVFDGHGLLGHVVSNKIKLFFGDYFSRPEVFGYKDNSIKKSNNYFNFSKINQANFKNIESINEEIIYDKLREKNYEIIRNSFYMAEGSLIQSKCEINFSGSTAVIVIIVGDKIICANAGDSRAILVSEIQNEKENSIIPLSRDHKPDLIEETKRIIKCGGRVDRYSDDGVRSGPFRVWLKYETYPGLAMSRSIGDLVASSVGVICEPGIILKYLTQIKYYRNNS